MRWRCAFIVRSVAVVTFAGAFVIGAERPSPVAEAVRRVGRWRRRWCARAEVAAGRRRRSVVVDAVLGHARRALLRPALAFDDAAEGRHALRIEFDVERGQVERSGLDHFDLAAAIAVARHDVDVAWTAAVAVAPIAP